MASIERTAYLQFKRNPVVRGLVAAYTPNEAEINFAFSQVQQPAHRLTLAILLKAFQRLGYFVPIDRVSPSVVRHIRGTLRLRVQIKPAEVGKNTRYRFREQIRAYLQVRRRRQAIGEMIIVRYADDIVCGFEHESEAK